MNDDITAPSNNSEDAESSLDGDLVAGQRQTTRKVQLLRAGSLLLGVFEDEIATIAEWRRPTPLPHAPTAVLGVVSIQGRMLTTLDPGVLAGEASAKDNSAHGWIVALRGDEQVALAIEDKAEVVELAVKDIQPPSEPTSNVIQGTFRNSGQIVNVLNVNALFAAAIKGRERRQRRF